MTGCLNQVAIREQRGLCSMAARVRVTTRSECGPGYRCKKTAQILSLL